MTKDNLDALDATAVGLAEDAKAERLKPAKKPKGRSSTEEDAATLAGLSPGEESVLNDENPDVEGAIERLGKAVEEHGEPEPETVVDRIERSASEFQIETKSLVVDVRDFMLEIVKRLDKPWGLTPNDQQRDIAAAVEQTATDLVRKVVEAVRADSSASPIRCLLVGYSDKGDDIKVDLKVKTLDADETTRAVVALHKAKGKHVLVTVASVDDYRGETRDPVLDPDEPALDFEAGPTPPADDSDLAAGDLAEVQRVDLKSGMIQSLPPGLSIEDAAEEDWGDVREASPEELAAERERNADFAAD